jgi:hypothetical protein
MLCLPLVLVPALGRPKPKTHSTLLVTGIWNLSNRHLPWDTILSTDLFAGVWGWVLAWKLALVGVILLLSIIHES